MADCARHLSDRRPAEPLSLDRVSNIILADQINRTPPKTQTALLDAMQEYQAARATPGGSGRATKTASGGAIETHWRGQNRSPIAAVVRPMRSAGWTVAWAGAVGGEWRLRHRGGAP